MSDVGQEFHTKGYRYVPVEGHSNIEHDNVGITRTFKEVDSAVSSDLPKQRDVQEETNPDSKVEDDSLAPTGKGFQRTQMKQQAESGDAKEEDETVGPAGDESESSKEKKFDFNQFDGRDVCLEQLYDLMDDTFDGEDSNRSYLAYCLDAQRMQWKHNLRRYYP